MYLYLNDHGKNKTVICTIKIVGLTEHYNIAIGIAIRLVRLTKIS